MGWMCLVCSVLIGVLPTKKLKKREGEFSYRIIMNGKETGTHRYLVTTEGDMYKLISVKKIDAEQTSFFDSTIFYIGRKKHSPLRAEVWQNLEIASYGPIKGYYDIDFSKGFIETTSFFGDTTPKTKSIEVKERAWLLEPLGIILAQMPLKRGKTYSFNLYFPMTQKVERAKLTTGEKKEVVEIRGKKYKANTIEISYSGRRFKFWVNPKKAPYLLKIYDPVMKTEEVYR
jgi:hypothetical protein